MISEGRTGQSRPYFLMLLAVGLCLAVLGYFLARGFAGNLAAGRTLVAEGRHAQALPVLEAARRNVAARLLDRSHEVDYLTGLCYWRTGEIEAALASLGRVPGNSPIYGETRLALAEVNLDVARWRAAEETLLDLIDHNYAQGSGKLEVKSQPESVPEVIEARKRLERYFRMQGRYQDAARQRFVSPWNAADPVALLKSAWRDERGTPPYETIREAIAIAEKLATDDSRVNLARAIVATAEGRYDEADATLKRCELPASKPDEAVLRARLDWMRASGRPFRLDSIAYETRRNHPVLDLADKLEWAEFLAERAGDESMRAKVLEIWRKAYPRSTTMLSRDASYLDAAGKTAEARESLRIKGEVDKSIERYGRFMTGAGKPSGTAQWLDWAQAARSAGQTRHAYVLAHFVHTSDPASEEAFRLANELQQESLQPMSYFQIVANLWEKAASKSGEYAKGEIVSQAEERGDPAFVDASEPAGLKFTFENGETEIRQMPVALGGGVGLIDFDDDGDLDVFVVQGGAFPFDPKDSATKPGDRLFRNLGDGRFEDFTEAAGLPATRVGYGHGVTVGDVNGDGFPDLFVTRFGSYALYLNEAGNRFRDVTEAWGLGGERDWPTSAAFADFDADGDLDLYVCHYVVWDAKNPRLCRNGATGRYMSCNPTTCAARADHLFRNDGGRFVDVSESAGITAADTEGRGLGVVAADFDDDGLVDVFVANDKSANFLFRNLGGMRFEEIARSRAWRRGRTAVIRHAWASRAAISTMTAASISP